ncbi:hypothetical protein CI109_107366 [Kwoniella shandongensis]|uniref:Uncharacterized protein n=1 Tax=Kwoniella shandongensis TaxID=1734106 RepID=A0A5M6BXN1_9TREE|nr:uncharacterized protein CI109_004706 [Kwoniella shandongensis]KAA5526930.1 hypothetical protein CI109_004706 [Kwoniella shandongensis]
MPAPACQAARDDLVSCLLRTDCVLKTGKTPTECLKHPDELPLQCQHLISRFTDCKKGMLDMRRRFRGNHLSDEAKDKARGNVLTAGAVDVVPDRYSDEDSPAQAR